MADAPATTPSRSYPHPVIDAEMEGRPDAPPPPMLHAPAISSHRLLSDGRSTALLRPDAELDWWCAPAMDAPPLLWSLLDGQGARARWSGVRSVRHGDVLAGPTTRTVVRHERQHITCWDGMLEQGEGSVLVRLVRGEDDDLDVEHELSLGGFDQPWACWTGRQARLESCTVEVRGGDPRVGPEGRLITRVRAPRGRWEAVVIAAGAVPDAGVEELVEIMGALAREHDTALRSARLPRHHPERAADALAVLAACTYRPTGAVVASPTTSLPEAPGHGRQFDYRYSWLRDASLAVSVAALLGRRQWAEHYLEFVHRITSDTRVPLAPMTDVRGRPAPDERTVDGVAGWAGSRPVRVGNAAKDQVQYDALGMLLEAVSVYLQTGGMLDHDTWSMVQAVADHLAAQPDGVERSNGIWELRDPQPLVSADLGRWLALDRALWIARMRHPLRRRHHWKRARDAAQRRVVAAIGDDGGLPQSYGDPARAVDASSLMAALFGVLDRRRASRLIDATVAGLQSWPHLYRYEPGAADGFSGNEGTFVAMSWWAVAALAAVGRVDEARRRADALCAVLPRLLAEEFDADDARSLGNVPLVWSHMAVARALYILDAAALRRRYTSVGLTLWRIGRYLRLRWA